MLTKDIDARVRHIICDQIGAPESDVLPEKHLVADLGFDSLDNVEFWMALEDEFNLVIEDEEGEKLRTVADAIALVRQKLQ